MTAAIIINQQFVAVCWNVQTWKELMLILYFRGWAHKERESHEPVPSAFFSPMNLPTRCLPPTSSQQWWNFSTSSLARFLLSALFFFLHPIHTFGPLFNLCVLLSCTPYWTLPSSICLSSFFFLLYSIPPLRCLFWQRAHFKLFHSVCVCLCVCVGVSHAAPLQQNSGGCIWGLKSFPCHCNLIKESLCLVKLEIRRDGTEDAVVML